MEIKITPEGIEISGTLADQDLRAHLAKESEFSLEARFLEIMSLGIKVRDAIETTATAEIIANSVEKVTNGLTALEAEHKDFIAGIMKDIVDPNSISDLALIKRLADWRKEFEAKLVEEFSPNATEVNSLSRIRSAIDAHLQSRDAQLSRLLSLVPDPEGREARPLLSVFELAKEIQEKLTENTGAKKSTRGNSAKGLNFESSVFTIVQTLADEFGDTADNTGRHKTPGTSGNDEGDIVVNFAYPGRAVRGKLVLECKHSLTGSPSSKSSLLAELDKGISNREADYGILVTNEANYASPAVFPFWEDADHRRAILILEDNHEELDTNKLRFAFLMAKARTLDLKTDVDQAKLNQIQSEIQTISSSYKRMASLKGCLTSASASLAELKGHIDYLDLNVGTKLTSLTELLLELDQV